MRATAVTRVPVLLLLLPLCAYIGVGVGVKVHVDGVVEGEAGDGGVDLCVELLEDEGLLGLEQGLVNPCIQTRFCVGAALDTVSQRACAPID